MRKRRSGGNRRATRARCDRRCDSDAFSPCEIDRIGHAATQVTIDEATECCDDGNVPTTPTFTVPSSPIDNVRALLADGRIAEVIALFTKLMANNGALQRQLAALAERRHKSSEVVSSAQLYLLVTELAKAQQEPDRVDRVEDLSKADDELRRTAEIDEELAAREKEKQEKPRGKQKRPARRLFPEKLRRVQNPIAVPAEDRPCPKCGGERKCIGHDVTETLELVPAELTVRQDQREKLACMACEGELCRAPVPQRVVAGGRMGVILVSCILVDKYRDGLPLHRQLERLRRLGVSIPITTMVDQVAHVAAAATILQQAAIAEVLAAHVMQLDATGMPVLDKARRNDTRYGTLWCYVGDGVVSLYLYASTGKKNKQREHEIGPEDFLAQRRGLVVADASNLFDASFKRDDLIECCCNAHGRRRFVKALDGGDSRAALPIGAFRKLYAIEREGRELSDEDRTALRQRESKPVFDAILKWCQAYIPYEPPSSTLGKAISYFINHHQALGRFLQDGAIPIDNNLVERQHVRVALTRKNFLFVGSDAGGERAAVIYTLLGSCALNDVDPVKYLADVLPRVRGLSLEQARALLPHRWKLAQPTDAAPPTTA